MITEYLRVHAPQNFHDKKASISFYPGCELIEDS